MKKENILTTCLFLTIGACFILAIALIKSNIEIEHYWKPTLEYFKQAEEKSRNKYVECEYRGVES